MNIPAPSKARRRSRRLGAKTVTALAAAALVSSSLVLPAVTVSAAPLETDYTQFVNPFIATEDDFGQDGPGAFTPNGLAKVTPLTSPRSHVGYDYNSTQMAGFTGITLDGVGGNGAGGDFLVVPTYKSYTARPGTGTYNKGYSHANEDASPGYYEINNLTEDARTIDARVTADTRTGVHEYTFDQAGKASLIVDLRNNFGNRNGATLQVGTTGAGNTSLSGQLDGYFYNANYRLYYYAETTRAVSSYSTWSENNLNVSTASRNGTDIGAILSFDGAAGQKVGLRVTFSPISVAQAKRDMTAEVGGKSFDDVRDAATDAWNDALGVVEVEEDADDDPTGDLKIQFYTHLFRMNGSPINATSTDGTYRGVDGAIYEADGYTHYDSWALWDDFRKYSSIAMIYPDRYRDIGQSLVDLFAELGNSSASSLRGLTHSVPTVRWERAAVVIADAISKGAKLEGLDLAYEALKVHSNGQYNSANQALGYIPNGIAETVGTSYDDWGMAVIADALGKSDEADAFRLRSTNYVNSFNKNALTSNSNAVAAGVSDVGLIMPRASNGTFGTQNPEQFEPSGAGLYQGTLWQYNWYAAQDMGGLIDLMGGRDRAKAAVSYHFGEQAPENCSRMLHSNANEIDLQAPYLFNYVGAPSHTQYWVRQILTEESCNRYIGTGSTSEPGFPSGGGEFNNPRKMYVYKNAPDGFLPTMDNDAGTMSSVFVGGALGLFPVTSGADSFQITSPMFEKITIHYSGGKNFVLNSSGVNADSFYIQDATFNGAPLERTWLTFEELTAGGTLDFTMGDEPSDWGENSPMAYSLSDEVDSAIYDPTQPVSTSSKVFTEAAENDGSIGNTITLTAHGATFAGANGADISSQVQASGLPTGLSVTATKTSNTTIALTLTGSATNHGRDNNTDGVTVTLAAAAFATNAPAQPQRTFALKVAFDGYVADLSTTTVPADAAGVVDGEITVTLSGGAQFAGANGSTLGASALQLVGLADGINATTVKTSDTTATISLSGTLTETISSTFVLAFTDEAFSGSVTAAEVTGTGLSGMSPVMISVNADLRGKLAALIAEAKLVVRGNYAAETFIALEGAITTATGVLADPDSSDYALRQGIAALEGALEDLRIEESGYRRLEAEANHVWSGGELKTEGGGTGTNIGGVERDSWVGYYGLDFSEAPLESFVIAYAHNPGSATANAKVEIRTGSAEGELVTTLDLPTTGGWANYTALTHEFTTGEIAALSGTSDVFFVFRGGDDTDKRWVANVDYFEFLPEADEDEEPAFEFAQLGPNNVTTMGPGMGRDPSGGPPYSNFGNTHNEEWIRFADVDMGPNGADTLTFRYDKPGSSSVPDTWIDIHFDSPTGTTVASSPMLANTSASGWGTYTTTEFAVDSSLFTGVKDVYIVFRMPNTHTSGGPYVGNFQWFQFDDTTAQADNTRYTVEFESLRTGHGPLSAAPGLTEGVDYSGTGLKTEGGNGGDVLAGTENGNWVRYQNIDLGDKFSSRMLVTYTAPDHRVRDASLAIFLDSRDGEPLVVTDLPNTEIGATNWNTYGTIAVDLPVELTGDNTLYFEFRNVPVPGATNAGNFDAFSLVYGPDKSDLRDAIDEFESLLDDESLYVGADFRVFTRALTDAQTVAAQGDASQAQVAAVLRQLNLAADQLEWKVVRQLNNLIAEAEAIDEDSVTPAAYAALVAALDDAKALDPATDSHADFVAAFGALTDAYEDLDIVYEPTLVGPSDDVEPGDVVTLTGAGFAPDEVVTFTWKDEPALTASWTAITTTDGSVSTSVTIPPTAVDGDYILVATGALSDAPVEVTISVLKVTIATVTSFVTIPTEAVEGDEVQIIVGVSAGATGDVELSVDGTVVATESLNAGGQATFTLASLAEGARTVTAAYLGQDSFLPSTSASVTIAVSAKPVVPAPEVISVSVPTLSKATQAFNSKPKLRASVTATVNGAKAGTVTFTAGKQTLGSAAIRQVGARYEATLTFRPKLPRGTYRAITATVRTTDGKTATSVASGATFKVVKATPKKARPKVTAKKFRAGTKAKIRVKVSKLTNGRHAVGRVRVRVGNKAVTTVKLRKKTKGKVTVTLPRAYSKQIKVSARFLPKKKNKNIKKSKWSKKVRVAVLR